MDNIMRRGLSPEGREIRDRHQGSITIGISGTALLPTERINRKGSVNHLQENVRRLKEIQATCRQRESRPRTQPLKALRQDSPVLSTSALKQAHNGNREFEQYGHLNKERLGSAHSDYFSMPDDHSAEREDTRRESQNSVMMPDIHQNPHSEASTRLRRERSCEGFRPASHQGSRPSSPKTQVRTDLRNGLTAVPNMVHQTANDLEAPPAGTHHNFSQTYTLTPEIRKFRMDDILKRIKSQRPACEIDIQSHYRNIERQHRALMKGGSASLMGSVTDVLTHRSNVSQGDGILYVSQPGSHRLTRASSADLIVNTRQEQPTHLNPIVSNQRRSNSRIHSANEKHVPSRKIRCSSRERNLQKQGNGVTLVGERRLAPQTDMPNCKNNNIHPLQRSKTTVGFTRKPDIEDLSYAQNHRNPLSQIAKTEVTRNTGDREQAPKRAFSKSKQNMYPGYPCINETLDLNCTRTLLSPREDRSQIKKGMGEIVDVDPREFNYQNNNDNLISPRQYSPEQSHTNLDNCFVTCDLDQLSTHPSVQGLSLDVSNDTLLPVTKNYEDPSEGTSVVATMGRSSEEQISSIPLSLQGPPSRSPSPTFFEHQTSRSPTPVLLRHSPVRSPSPVPIENSTPRSPSPMHSKQSAARSPFPVSHKHPSAGTSSPILTKEPMSSSKTVLSKQNKSILKHSSLNENVSKTSHLPETYKKGELPRYLQKRKEKQKLAEEAAAAIDHDCPPGHQPLPDHERRNTLHLLKKSQAAVMRELSSLPISQDTLRVKHLYKELEAKLAQIEDGIRIFSQPKVYVMNDG
ncbi:uncharacterized protein LOC143025457 isoform X2 [Oratosquilla oratoria]